MVELVLIADTHYPQQISFILSNSFKLLVFIYPKLDQNICEIQNNVLGIYKFKPQIYKYHRVLIL